MSKMGTRTLIENYDRKRQETPIIELERRVLPGIIPRPIKGIMRRTPILKTLYNRELSNQIKEINQEIKNNDKKEGTEKLTPHEITKLKQIRADYGRLAGIINQKTRRTIRNLRRTIATREKIYADPNFAKSKRLSFRDQEKMEGILEGQKIRYKKLRDRLLKKLK